MIHETFYSLITSRTSPVLTNVYPVTIPQEVEYPAVRYARISSVRGMNFDEVENWVRTVFQVDTYAETPNQAISTAETIKAAINDYRGGDIQGIRLDSEFEMYEDGVDLYRVMQQFTVWHTET